MVKTIFVVVKCTNDAGWIISSNVKGFSNYADAFRLANALTDYNDDDLVYYEVEELLLEE